MPWGAFWDACSTSRAFCTDVARDDFGRSPVSVWCQHRRTSDHACNLGFGSPVAISKASQPGRRTT